MKQPEIEQLGEGIALIAIRAAKVYLDVHGLTADPGALSACISSWVKIKFPEAARDAMAAFDCGMVEAGKLSFAASIAQAGIEAAKEAGKPICSPS